MGQISILTKEQKSFLDLIKNNKYLRENFYFTGGTVLSEFYLKHRYSDDLDFFSESKVDQEAIFTLMSNWSKEYNFKFTSRFVEVVYWFNIQFENNTSLKVDFAYYPHKRVEKGIKYQDITVDSLRDIAVNKVVTINQRTDAKDFVDLYFLLQNDFSIWDLLYGVESKFSNLDLDLLLLAEDFLKVEDFDVLPRMIKPLKLDDLKSFFREKAKMIGKKAVE